MALLYLDNTVDIIDFLGGNVKVAAMLDTSPKAVGNWRYSGRFPADTYLALQKALKKTKGEAPDTLWPMKPLHWRRAKKL